MHVIIPNSEVLSINATATAGAASDMATDSSGIISGRRKKRE